MTGTTGLHDLRIDCIVGIHPHERVTPQPVILDLELDYDFAPAAASDAIADVINYDAVVAQVTDLIQSRKFQLIESMAEATVALLWARHPSIERIRLEIRKPAAVPAAASSFVRVDRSRVR